MQSKKEIHPAIWDLDAQQREGKISRREFLRLAALLGMSSALSLQVPGLFNPRTLRAESVQRGGTLRIASQVHHITNPARFSWLAPAQQIRQVAEYLTYTDAVNITHPHLLRDWQVSEDLKTWTLNLRKGVTFNNGDPFVADDVIFTMKQWLSKDVNSSMASILGGYLSPQDIEKASEHQVILHLQRPEIAVPEHLFHYPALILNHRTFEGDFLAKPHGTGPFTIQEYRVGEKCVLKRRKDYWQTGDDGQNLPYLDSVIFLDMGTDNTSIVTGMKSGVIDTIDFGDLGSTQAFLALRKEKNVVLKHVPSAQTRILRMRVDKKPWDDNRVRTALKLCQHRQKILKLAYFDEGLLGQDFHVYPYHPAYCEQPTPEYDPERARHLLQEAGYSQGLKIDLTFGKGWPEIVSYAEVLKSDARQAGFDIRLQPVSTAQYQSNWTEVDLGITPWYHRPLGTMALNLGYSVNSQGKPSTWNETRWVDPEFLDILDEASGTLDVNKRRKLFCKLESIQQHRGSIGNAFWMHNFSIFRSRVRGLEAHPNSYLNLDSVWLTKQQKS